MGDNVVPMLDQQTIGRLVEGLIKLGLKLQRGGTTELIQEQLLHSRGTARLGGD